MTDPPEAANSDILIFTSPKAGTGAGSDRIDTLADTLRRAGRRVWITSSVEELRHRTDPGTSPQLPDAVVPAGGDGTLSLVAHNTPPNTVLVPMPLGTENLLARHYGMSSDVAAMTQAILHGTEIRIDAGLANGRLFLVMASCGFDAEVVRVMHLTRRGHINRFSYAWPILRTIRSYRFPAIQVEYLEGLPTEPLPVDLSPEVVPGEPPPQDPAVWQQPGVSRLECRWALVFNLPRYAVDLAVEPDACEDDGVLDLCSLAYGSVFSGTRYLGGIVTKRHIRWKDVVRRHITRCRITSDSRVAFQIDGDYAGRLPLEIGILPGRIRLRLAGPPARRPRPALAGSVAGSRQLQKRAAPAAKRE